MKRCFSFALILALLGSTVAAPALAEEPEVVSENVEAPVAEVELLGDIDLAMESEVSAPEQTEAQAVGESPVDTACEDSAVLAAESEEHAPGDGQAAAKNAAPSDTEVSAPEGADPAQPQPATGIKLSAKSVTIGRTETYKGLSVVAQPEGSVLPKITWRSGNSKVVKVNSKTGAITGVKKGSTKVYAKMAGSKTEVSCKVTVKQKPNKISVKPSSKTLGLGFTLQLKYSLPSGCASGKIRYESSKSSVATVDAHGLVTATAPGTATITVSTFNKKKAKCKVTVLDAPASVQFPDETISLAVGQSTALNASARTSGGKETPANFTYAIDESSKDAGCVQLDAATGKLKGVRKGEAVIRATAHNGVTGLCAVDVDVAPASVKLNVSSATIGVKEQYVGLIASVQPPSGASSCAQTVTWSSSDKKIAKVDSRSGVITGVKKGSCIVTAKTPNGKTAKCKVKVLKAPTKKTVSISPSNGALKVGQSGQFKVSMSKGYGGSLTYESKDTSVATIDNNGIVTAVGPGTTKIVVTTYNGVKKTASLVVNGGAINPGDDKASGANAEKIEYLIGQAKGKLGKPYVYGSFGPNSFDCSGFVYWCYQQLNVTLKASAYKQGYDDTYAKIAYSDLKPGDVVVFNTNETDSDLSDHTGIYIGSYQFIHASSSAKKVIISSLKSGYYQRVFSWGRRILK